MMGLYQAEKMFYILSRQNNLTTFKLIQGHRNQYGSIGYLRLPVTDP